mmetsp:Transcript_20097/g.30215  ORF Transcript_20097/g.30215 Transcript_20097/m.30215 type:complete len:379 (+) Transcript_20097:3-1139(+)
MIMNSNDSASAGNFVESHDDSQSIGNRNQNSNDDLKSKKYSKSDIPHRHVKVLTGVFILLVVCLLILFKYVRLSFHPRRQKWWQMLNSEKKDTSDVQYYQFWELFLSLVMVPFLAYWFRHRLSRYLFWIEYHPRSCVVGSMFLSGAITVIVATIVWRPPCHGWIPSDVGYLWVDRDAGSHNIHMVCEGHVWEPHVARAVEEYLYGQGRAMDVGAFVGYHTLRLARAAAPYTVYAIEGRPKETGLIKNLKRNNAKNVEVIDSIIKPGWTLNPDIYKELLEDDDSPLAFIKIDCEGCEMHFLKAMKDAIVKWKPVIVIEIQDDDTRQNAKVGGQRLIGIDGMKRNDVLKYLREDLGYDTVTALLDEDGNETWDYLAMETK